MHQNALFSSTAHVIGPTTRGTMFAHSLHLFALREVIRAWRGARSGEIDLTQFSTLGSVNLEGRTPLSQGFADLVRGVFLDEMQTSHRDLSGIGPATAELTLIR